MTAHEEAVARVRASLISMENMPEALHEFDHVIVPALTQAQQDDGEWAALNLALEAAEAQAQQMEEALRKLTDAADDEDLAYAMANARLALSPGPQAGEGTGYRHPHNVFGALGSVPQAGEETG